MPKFFIGILIVLASLSAKGQIHYYSDCFKGGVTGDGYNPSYFASSGNLNISISPSSSIIKAYLFYNVIQPKTTTFTEKESTIFLNSSEITISTQNQLTSFNIEFGLGKIYTYAVDVTSIIQPNLNTYVLTPPSPVDPLIEVYFAEYYLLVLYEDTNLSLVNIDVFLNNKNSAPNLNYTINTSNVLNPSNHVGLAIHASNICDTTQDGSFVSINSSPIGLLGGQEGNTIIPCGVTGSFNYQNNTLYGIGNDTPDNIMGGLDAIADISSYLMNNTNFDLRFDYQSNSGPYSNTFNQFFLTYTTPCDTFFVSVPNDTTVCKGAQLQLNVTGCQSYEWASTSQATGIVPGLSCSDCPNPVFTADSSMTYTVRIWNNDSCSVVRPVKINVAKDPAIENFAITSTECGTNTGKMIATPTTASYTPISYTLDNLGSQSSSTFNNLGAGAHQLHLEDARGCSSDTTFFVPQTISAQANFQTTPLVGFTPHDIYLLNTSTNASDYLWQIDGANQGNDLTHYTFNDQGTFEITLIAWKYDPSCSDTTSKTAYVQPQLIIPTAFTPDNDLINDTWEIEHLDEMYPKNIVQIYNRWGELLFESQAGNYNSNPWNGTYQNKRLPVGSYYFIIQTNDEEAGIVKGTVSLVFSY